MCIHMLTAHYLTSPESDVNMGLITESCANSAVLVEVQEYEVLSYILSSNLITKVKDFSFF